MKLLPLLVYSLMFSLIISCSEQVKQKTKKPAAESFEFPVPKGWQSENIQFPIQFAPAIDYSGSESLRFMPGFENAASEQYWSYTFLWWLQGKPVINDSTLKQDLKNYYQGLVQSNAREKNIPAAKLLPPDVVIEPSRSPGDDVSNFSGEVTFTDYMDIAQKKIRMYCAISKQLCGNHTAILFKLSPQPPGNKVWQQLDSLGRTFKCLNTEL